MVEVVVTASVRAAGGPTVPLGTTLGPESYTYAAVDLDAAGGTVAEGQIALPGDGRVVLLAVAAKVRAGAHAGTPARVSVTLAPTPSGGGPLVVDGTLLVANADVLNRLAPPSGPRSVAVRNEGTNPATVEVFACHAAPQPA
jgi:hypothetical protein